MSVPKPTRSAVPSRDTVASPPAEKSHHTEGPWHVAHSGYANTPFIIFAGEKAPNWKSRFPLSGVNVIAEVRHHRRSDRPALFHDESPAHEERRCNAYLIAAAEVGRELAEALCAQADDGLDRSAYILTRAIEFRNIARGSQ